MFRCQTVSVDKRQHYNYSLFVRDEEGTIIKKHPNKEIRAAIDYAISKGWIFEESLGHPFGRLRCGTPDVQHKTHQCSVWSTPKNAQNHAKQIRRLIEKCGQ